jgi:hypothetical protein
MGLLGWLMGLGKKFSSGMTLKLVWIKEAWPSVTDPGYLIVVQRLTALVSLGNLVEMQDLKA